MHRYDTIRVQREQLRTDIIKQLDVIFNEHQENGEFVFSNDIYLSDFGYEEDEIFDKMVKDNVGLNFISENGMKHSVYTLNLDDLYRLYSEVERLVSTTTYADIVELLPPKVKISNISVEEMLDTINLAIEHQNEEMISQNLLDFQNENSDDKGIDCLIQDVYMTMLEAGLPTVDFWEINHELVEEIFNRDVSIELFMENEVDVVIGNEYYSTKIGDLLDNVFDTDCILLADKTKGTFFHAKVKDIKVETKKENRIGNKLELINYSCE